MNETDGETYTGGNFGGDDRSTRGGVETLLGESGGQGFADTYGAGEAVDRGTNQGKHWGRCNSRRGEGGFVFSV